MINTMKTNKTMRTNTLVGVVGLLAVTFMGVACATAAALAVRAPTAPLAERVSEAETIFLGKLANKVTDGDWVRADLVVEEPLRDAERGHGTAVIWRAKIDGMPIYDAAEGARGIAILKDKHEGRYWLRDDKFEDPGKLNEVKALIAGAMGVEVNGMRVALVHPALFHADDALGFTLQLKNLSDRDQSFVFGQGISGTTIGTMTWKIKEVKTATIWKAVANPNPGPAPGMPESMGVKTLKPGESFDAAVRVLRWGQMFGTDAEPPRTAAALPYGKYVAELAVDVRANDQGQWNGSFTVKSREFEVSAQPRPVPVKERKKRGEILTLARERMVNYWEQQKDHGNAHCKALALADLQAAAVKVEESVGQGLEQGQTIYNITFLAPCPQLGGKVRFQWSFNEFGDERSMAGVQLIKEAGTSPPNP